uniref:Uncharacterized protein n=2 Tax=Varanus komodoensis TaxID=61221 RepID=A0A8D2IPB0_VARKO
MKKALSEQIKLLQSSAGINKQFREEFHKFEIENKCCGVLNGVEDWGNNKQEYQGCACEKQDQGTDFCKGSQYKTPCSEVILELIKKNMIIVMGVAFGLAFIEILGMVFSMILYCQIQNK